MAIDVGRRLFASYRMLSTLCALSVLCAFLLALPQGAKAVEIRAVVELFTSQGCSASPSADRLLGELARDPSIVALTLPVDYWDYLGWKDTLAIPQHSARQQAYAHERGDRNVATPQAVINGAIAVVGSDRAAIARAMAGTQKPAMTVPVRIETHDGMLVVSAEDFGGPSTGPSSIGQNSTGQGGEVWLNIVTRQVAVTVARGENSGQSLTYYNVGRRRQKLGVWDGRAARWTLPLADIRRDGVDAVAVIVQSGSAESPGPILGAAFASLP